ncbi:MAG: histidine kinase dimerization/phospho-acceptor domain-containing protein [Casimicrobiaceae bacterium]
MFETSVLPRETWNPTEFSRVLGMIPAAAYVCDSQGLITYFNRRAAEIWGREPLLNDARDRYCGSFRIYTRTGAPLVHEECWMARALREDRPFNGYELTIEQPDGKRISALAHANPIHDEDGELLGAVNVLVDISDQRRSEATKDDFLALLGHELRNPLGPVRNAVHILRSKGNDDKQSTWALELIERQLAELLALIDSVGEVSRLSRGKIQVQRSSFNVAEMVTDAAEAVRPSFSRKGQSLDQSAAVSHVTVDADRAVMRRAVEAMLQAASRQARSGASVTLATFATADQWGLTVAWGASAQETLHVLPDERASSSPETSPGLRVAGTDFSVDLALARGLVEAHGGSLRMAPTGCGYRIEIPVAHSPNSAPAHAND